MTLRYLALAWLASDAAQALSARAYRSRLLTEWSAWQAVLDLHELLVLVERSSFGWATAYPIEHDGGVVLGQLFDRDYEGGDAPRAVNLAGEHAERVVSTEGRHLLTHFWGAYVAFVRNPRLGRTWVVRDPTGGAECFCGASNGVSIFFTRLQDFETLTSTSFAVNWQYLQRHVLYGDLPSADTGALGIQRLLPGECLVLSSEEAPTRRRYWSLLQIATHQPISDTTEARNLLRRVARASVHAWASRFPSILLHLSGGLDSAIVLACLRDAPGGPHIHAVNYYSKGADSDERGYARLAAQHAGVVLIERERNAQVSWEPLLGVGRSPAPCAVIGNIHAQESIAELVARHGITVQFTGTGGDVLFYRHHAYLAAADHAKARGLEGDTYRHALSAAYLDRTSVWAVFKNMLRYGFWGREFEVVPNPANARPLLSAAFVAAMKPYSEGNLVETYDAPAGKQYQASCLAYALSPALIPLAGAESVPEMSPLLSQPIIEACLRVPLYVLMCRGRDRALARDAFSGEIPRAIENRQSKGGLEEHALAALRHNMSLAQHLLIGGQLVKAGWLDERKLREALGGDPSRSAVRVAELYEYLNVEAWLSAWLREPRAPAF